MGMGPVQVLARIEMPITLPFIVAGIRTAAVQVVATATLAALVAGGGLGRYIVDGFALQDNGQQLGKTANARESQRQASCCALGHILTTGTGRSSST